MVSIYLSQWFCSGKHQDLNISKERSTNSSTVDAKLMELDKEYDAVLVLSDGGCLSGSEFDGSDWSIGWLEPTGIEFQSHGDCLDDSFAVLIRCYGCDLDDVSLQKIK